MRCNSANMLRHAAQHINRAGSRYGYDFSLEEMAKHIEDVRAGKNTLAEFAAFYMIEPAKAEAAHD